jgi:hypothetical protein
MEEIWTAKNLAANKTNQIIKKLSVKQNKCIILFKKQFTAFSVRIYLVKNSHILPKSLYFKLCA